MKLTAIVAAGGLIALSVVMAVVFLETEPARDSSVALEYADDDPDKLVEIPDEQNPGDTLNRAGSFDAVKREAVEIEAADDDEIKAAKRAELREALAKLQKRIPRLDDAEMEAAKLAGYGTSGHAETYAAEFSELQTTAQTLTEELRTPEELKRFAELQAARKEYDKFLNSDYFSYDTDTLRSLAAGSDRKAQLVLAQKLYISSVDSNDGNTRAEALRFAVAAAESGEARAAILASQISAMENQTIQGYAYLLKFERQYGADIIVRRNIDIYPVMHFISTEELNRRVEPFMNN